MGTRNRHSVRWLAVAFAAAAVAAPAALAGPDDRPYYRGTTSDLAPTTQSPDDRAFDRGGSDLLAPSSLSPDDRPFLRSSVAIEPVPAPISVGVPTHGFDWGDALMGSTFGLALAILGMGAIVIAYRRRTRLGTA